MCKEKMRKIWAIVLVIVLVVTIFPIQEQVVSAKEEQQKYTFGDYTYVEYESEEYGNGVYITDYNRESGIKDLQIPNTIDGKSVIGIDEYAFFENDSLVSVEIPSSVKWIGRSAFKRCIALQNVKLAEGIKGMDDFAFSGCQKLKNINIPSTLEILGTNFGYCFESCSALEKFTVSSENKNFFSVDGVLCKNERRCDHNGFEEHVWGEDGYCVDTKDIILILYYPGGKKGEFIIEENMRIAYADCFKDALALEKITVSSDNEGKYFSRDGVLFYNAGYEGAGNELIAYPCAKEGIYEIPDDVTYISSGAFYHSKLTEVSIPDSVVSISIGGTFSGCYNLKKITIGKNIDVFPIIQSLEDAIKLEEIEISDENQTMISIDNVVYSKDKSELLLCPRGLKGKITMPDEVKTVASRAFVSSDNIYQDFYEYYICDNIDEIYIGTSYEAENMLNLPFYGISSLKKYSVSMENQMFSEKDGMLYSKDMSILYSCPDKMEGSVNISTKTKKIVSDCFEGCSGLTNVTIPNSVTEMNYCGLLSPLFKGTITGYENSVAQKYAEENNIQFISIGKNTSISTPTLAPTKKPTTTQITKPDKIKLKSAKSTGKKKLKVVWNKNTKIAGYQIQIALNNKFTKSKKTKNVAKNVTSIIFTKLKSKTTYYVRMRACNTLGSKKVYGEWSTVKKCKVK